MKALVPDLAIVPRLLTRSALVTVKGNAGDQPTAPFPTPSLSPSSDDRRKRGIVRLTSDSRIADGESLVGDIRRDSNEELLLGVEGGRVSQS